MSLPRPAPHLADESRDSGCFSEHQLRPRGNFGNLRGVTGGSRAVGFSSRSLALEISRTSRRPPAPTQRFRWVRFMLYRCRSGQGPWDDNRRTVIKCGCGGDEDEGGWLSVKIAVCVAILVIPMSKCRSYCCCLHCIRFSCVYGSVAVIGLWRRRPTPTPPRLALPALSRTPTACGHR